MRTTLPSKTRDNTYTLGGRRLMNRDNYEAMASFSQIIGYGKMKHIGYVWFSKNLRENAKERK